LNAPLNFDEKFLSLTLVSNSSLGEGLEFEGGVFFLSPFFAERESTNLTQKGILFCSF